MSLVGGIDESPFYLEESRWMAAEESQEKPQDRLGALIDFQQKNRASEAAADQGSCVKLSHSIKPSQSWIIANRTRA
jgi:hypothetical protein